jgi:zinc transport system permease protein
VLRLNLLLAVLTAVTVVVSMRVVGLLLALCLGVTVAVSGVAVSYYTDTPSGGTIVALAITAFAVVTVGAGITGRLTRRRWAGAGAPAESDPLLD